MLWSRVTCYTNFFLERNQDRYCIVSAMPSPFKTRSLAFRAEMQRERGPVDRLPRFSALQLVQRSENTRHRYPEPEVRFPARLEASTQLLPNSEVRWLERVPGSMRLIARTKNRSMSMFPGLGELRPSSCALTRPYGACKQSECGEFAGGRARP